MNIKDVSLGFSRNMTLRLDVENNYSEFNIDSIKKKIGNEKLNLKMVISCQAEDKDAPFVQRLVKEVKELENVSKLVVIYDVAKVSNIRSESIINAESNIDKLKEYCRVNEIEFTPGMEQTVKEIEENLNIKYFNPNKSFTLLKMDLRGAIGIKEGTGKDEISVDFRDFTPGIIYLTGPNGSGKSTLLENMSPFPRLLTRNGKLQDHFYLKDSYRKLIYKDEADTYYRVEILIDGKTEKGKVKYLVYSGKDIDNLSQVPECDGNSAPYDEWVARNFGTIELFLRTCFFTKEATKGIPDLSEASKGQKKELFSTLLGLNTLSDISAAAKKKIDDIKDERDDLQECVEKEDELDDIIDSEINDIKEYQKDKSETETEIKNLEKLLLKTEKDLEKLEDGSIDEKKSKLASLIDMTETLCEIRDEIIDYESKKELYDKVLKNQDEIKSLEKNRESLLAELTELKDIYDKKNSMMLSLNMDLSMKETSLNTFKETATFNVEENCPTCNQKLPFEKLKEIKDAVKKNNDTVSLAEKEIAELKSKQESLKTEIEEALVAVESHEADIQSLTDRIKFLNNECEGLSPQFVSYMTGKYNKNRSVDITPIEAMEKEIAMLQKELKESEDTTTAIKECKDLITDYNNEIAELKEISESYQFKIGVSTERLNNARIEKENLEINKEKFEKLSVIYHDCEVIQKAFSRDGIQALELEALSPEIAEITNTILKSAYGDRFSVSFKTLREGSSHNMIEDFSIVVSDNETGTERPLEWLSSGESIWIKEALYNAFTSIRNKSTGFSFKTRFLDETDGSLDPSKRMVFLKMLEAAHKAGEVAYTLLITHSQELKDLILQEIKLK